MVVIDPNVVFASLDNFLADLVAVSMGSIGTAIPPTETRIINIMMEVIFASIQEAWSPIMEINCEQIGSEINPAFVQIVDEMIWSLFVTLRWSCRAKSAAQSMLYTLLPL